MKTFLAAALVLSVHSEDETSLMQGLARKIDGKLGVDHPKGHDTAKLMETATTMLKNGAGVTPDVVEFIERTLETLHTNVLGVITREHFENQQSINDAVAEMERVVSVCDDDKLILLPQATDYDDAINAHHNCRLQESHKCGESRECEVELIVLWQSVKREESRMREIHTDIHEQWCVNPVDQTLGIPCFGEDCWQWPAEAAMEGPETSQTAAHYPVADYHSDVRIDRGTSVTSFNEYIVQKARVEEAWALYNVKILQCADLETDFTNIVTECDTKDDEVSSQVCSLTEDTRDTRRRVGREWEAAVLAYDVLTGVCTNAAGESCDIHASSDALRESGANWESAAIDQDCTCTGIRQLEFDRKREWESLQIVTCLLDTVYTHVQRSIETSEPCPTIESHPDETQNEITHCHVIEASLTTNLTIDYCGDDLPLECPAPCELPPTPEPRCTAEYVYETQGHWGLPLQGSFVSDEAHHLTLSEAGWGSCAAPKVCVDCLGHNQEPANAAYTLPAAQCLVNELDLVPGQSDRDTFRCLDTSCLPMAGRCNGISNCHDGSDELGCNTAWEYPALLQQHQVCREGANVVPGTADDVQFFCNDGSCTAVEGRCNGHNNCADGSDEMNCPTNVDGVTLEATSGHTVSLETIAVGADLMHDRQYTVESLGSFTGMKFVKISNEDKNTPHDHVQLKLRLPQPMSVYVVTTQGQTLPWLFGNGWTEVPALTGVEYSGMRMTPDKEWSGHTDVFDRREDHYGRGHVYEKTFPAGVVSMPGNGGGQGYLWSSGIEGGHGSYLTFVTHPSNPPSPHLPVVHDARLTAYWDAGSCGAHGNDHNAAWCGGVVNGNHPASHCEEFVTVGSDICASQVATLQSYEGDGTCCSSVTINSCDYAYFAQYRCAEDHEVPVVVLPVQFDTRLSAYWDAGNCGPHGNDHNWDWCNRNAGHPAQECATSVEVATDLCASGHASLESTQGTGECCSSVVIDTCNFAYFAQYVCSDAPGPIVIQPVAPLDSRLTAYWDGGACGPHGDDYHWDWCGRTDGNCPDTVTVDSSLCASNQARLETLSGTGACCDSAVIDGCGYAYHAQYVCA